MSIGSDVMPPVLDLSTTVAAQPPDYAAAHVRRVTNQIVDMWLKQSGDTSDIERALTAFIMQFPIHMRPALLAIWLRPSREWT